MFISLGRISTSSRVTAGRESATVEMDDSTGKHDACKKVIDFKVSLFSFKISCMRCFP